MGLGCVLGAVVGLVNNITSSLGIPLTDGLGAAQTNDSSSPYTVVEVKTFINELDFSYSGPWTFKT